MTDMNVLLIDDDPWIRDSLSLFFQNAGCRVTTRENIEEGMAAIELDRFDLILSDYWLPDMDGLSFLKMTVHLQPDAMKVLMTAYPEGIVESELRAAGIDEFIHKPFIFETMEKLMDQLKTMDRQGRTGTAS